MAEIDGSALWSLRDVIRDAVSSAISAAPKDSGRTSAQFVRRDQDGTAWYRLLGSDVDTPCVGGEAAEFSEGDWAEVEVRDGSIYAIGNTSDPAARSSVVRAVSSRVNTVIRQSEIISNIANAAKDVAEATNQHFFSDDNGVHVTQVTQEVWEQAHEGPNMLLNSIGQLFRDGLANLISITTQAGARAITFWDGLGNDAENVTASFGGDGATIGRADKSHMALDYHSLRMIDMEGNTYLHISDLRDESGVTEITDEFIGDETKTSFALTYRATSRDYDVTVSDGSGGTVTKLTTGVMFSEPPAEDAVITVVYLTESPEIKAYTLGKRGTGSIGPMSFVIGNGCVASGRNAYAEGGGSTASGVGSHAECGGTASGTGSHAEGNSEASGVGSHAEGGYSTASGNGSHAEGSSIASGALSHAEGMNAQADGDYSHAQNLWTIAGSDYQTAIGKYNANDPDNAFEIGNGTADNARSNAFSVEWTGAVRATLQDSTVTVNAAAATERTGYNHCWHNGVTCTVQLGINLVANLASGSSRTIGTVPEGWRPPYTAYCAVYGSAPAIGGMQGYITDAGAIVIRNNSDAAVTRSPNIYVMATYAM